MFKKVIANTGAQTIGKGITASITLLVALIIGRSLGPEGYGDFTKIAVFVGYFYTLADFGLNTVYIKIAKEETVNHLKPLLGLRIIIGISLAVFAALTAQLFPYDPITQTGFSPTVKLGIIIASTTIVTQSLFITANAFFQKILRYDLSTLAATASYMVILISAAVITFTAKSVLAYTAAYSIGGIFLVLTAYLIISRRVKTFFAPTFKKDEFSAFLKPAWPVGIALLFNLIYFRIDVLILSSYRPTSEVGLYGLAYQFFEAALAIPIFFSNAIYPLLTDIYKKSIDEFKAQVAYWTKILIAIALLLTAGLTVASLFIPIFFGEAFIGSVRVLQILAIGMPFFFISALLWHLMIIYDRQKYLTVIYAAGAVFNITANLILIPRYGITAAAIITVASEALVALTLAAAIKLKVKN